jgi:hypothetical protein
MSLAPLAELSRRVRRAPWFAAVGEPLSDVEREEAREYLAALGLGARAVAPAAGWREAERIIRAPDGAREWWAAEERHARDLRGRALDRAAERDLLAALTEVVVGASDAAHGAATAAAARAGLADPALTRVAAGAAAQAGYQAALALAAGAGGGHPFAAKLRLFEAGRWPLGVVGTALHLF